MISEKPDAPYEETLPPPEPPDNPITATNSILVSLHNVEKNETTNMIVEPFNIHIKYKDPGARVVLGFNYPDAVVGDRYNMCVMATNDTSSHYAHSSGGLDSWKMRVAFNSCVCKGNEPLVFEGIMQLLQRNLGAPIW